MLSRRSFLATASALAANAAAPTDRLKLREFGYPQVTLTQGPIAEMYRRTRAHFLGLDEDRLLKIYRQRVGLPAPGQDMGGWYDANGFVPGHLLGQFISGYARLGGDDATAKARRLVLGYAETFEKDKNPFAARKASDTWACYVLDKYTVDLLDAATLANIPEARELLPRLLDAGQRFIPDHVFDRIGVRNPPYDEPYILPENLFRTYELTGDPRHLAAAKRYLLDEFFDPLARGENVLPGKHGYSHVIALSSAAKAYQHLGDDRYLRAVRNAWDMLVDTQQYASGAWAAEEMFVKPRSGELAATLTRTRNHYETPCCFYAHAKLARYLTMFTGESKYGDGLERALYNTILGALDPGEDGNYFYYSDYQSKARKGYYKQKWPCCAGTLLQSVADFPLNIYFEDARGVSVNLYAGSELRWKNGKITQRTTYPEAEQIEIHVERDTPADFDLRLRIPAWLERPPAIAINGRAASVKAAPGTFATVSRRWRNGDTIELRLPFTTRIIPIEERAPDTVAILRGPVMLVAVDPPDDVVLDSPGLRLRPWYQVRDEVYTTYFRRVAG